MKFFICIQENLLLFIHYIIVIYKYLHNTGYNKLLR